MGKIPFVYQQNLFKKFFTEKVYKSPGEDVSQYDVVVDVNKCGQVQKGGTLCEKCYHEPLLDLMGSLTFKQREEFIQYQVNQQPDPLRWLNELKGLLFDIDTDEVMDISAKAHYQAMIGTAIEQIKALTAGPTPDAKAEKIKWRRDNDLFFVFFSAMYEEGFFDIKKGSNDELRVAQALYQSFQINSRQGDKEEIKFTTFHQHFKGTSSLQTDKAENIELKNKIRAFLKSLPS